jgi:hypothetical protein
MTDGRIGALERYILGLCASERPRVCFLPTASGDSDGLLTRFYEAFAEVECDPSHVALFRPHPQRVAERLLAADAIYVGGGSTANLIAIWGAHRLGAVLRRAWERGVVLSGVSAGAICWFEYGVTDSLGAGFAPVKGLGLAAGGFCPHADGDPARVPALRELIDRGRMPSTLAGRRRCRGAPRGRRAGARRHHRPRPRRAPHRPERGLGGPGARPGARPDGLIPRVGVAV